MLVITGLGLTGTAWFYNGRWVSSNPPIGTPIDVTDADGNTATGYIGNPVPGVPGAVLITTFTPTTDIISSDFSNYVDDGIMGTWVPTSNTPTIHPKITGGVLYLYDDSNDEVNATSVINTSLGDWECTVELKLTRLFYEARAFIDIKRVGIAYNTSYISINVGWSSYVTPDVGIYEYNPPDDLTKYVSAYIGVADTNFHVIKLVKSGTSFTLYLDSVSVATCTGILVYDSAPITAKANCVGDIVVDSIKLESTVAANGWATIDPAFDFDDVVVVNNNNNGVTKEGLSAEVTTISDITAGSTITGGDYFLISSTSQDYYVWYKVDSVGTDPEPAGLFIEGILVSILSTDNANTVAVKTAAAMDGTVFDVPTPAGTTIVITNIVLGESVNVAVDGNTGFTINGVRGTEEVSYTQFASAGTSAKIYSSLENIKARTSLKSAISSLATGMMSFNPATNATISVSVTPRVPIYVTVTDTLLALDETQIGWNFTVNESLVLTDTVSHILGLMIEEWLGVTDSIVDQWHGQEIINESLSLYDLVTCGNIYLKTINESLVVTDTVSYRLAITVLEYLGFTDLVTGMKNMTETVNESLTLTDTVERGFEKTVNEVLALVDTSTVITKFFSTISESLTATDASSLIKKIGVTLNDTLVLVDTVSNMGRLYSTIYDTLQMNVIVELDGEVWECYALNTPKFYPSVYSGFNFNSYCVFENRAYGANETGVYELTGSTDAGATIHTGVVLSSTNFGSANQKKFRRGYLGISGTAPVMVFDTEDGERQAYNIDTQGRVVASSELKSKSWKLSIADFDELDSIKLLPIILTK